MLGDLSGRVSGRQVGDNSAVTRKPKGYSKVGIVAISRNKIGDLFQVQFERFKPTLHLVMGKAQTAVRVFLAQKLQLMRSKIDDQKAATALAGSSRKCSTWWIATTSNDRGGTFSA